MALSTDFLKTNFRTGFNFDDKQLSNLSFPGVSVIALQQVQGELDTLKETPDAFINACFGLINSFDYTVGLKRGFSYQDWMDQCIKFNTDDPLDEEALLSIDSVISLMKLKGDYDEIEGYWTYSASDGAGAGYILRCYQSAGDVYWIGCLVQDGQGEHVFPILGHVLPGRYPDIPQIDKPFVSRYVLRYLESETPVPFLDFLNDLKKNMVTYEFMSETIGSAKEQGSDLASKLMMTWNSYSERFSFLGSLKSGFVSAFVKGGRRTLLSIMGRAVSATVETEVSDNRIQFSDPNAIMPQAFLSGILSGVLQIGAAFITAIGVVLNPLISIIGFAVSTLVSFITGIFNTIIDTRARVHSDPEQTYCPLILAHLCADDINDVDLTVTNELVNQLKNHDVPILIHSIASYMIVSHDSNASYPLRIEAFPDLINRYDPIIHGTAPFGLSIAAVQNGYRFYYDPIIVGQMDPGEYVPDYNPVTGILTESSDQKLRYIILANIALSYLGMFCIENGVNSIVFSASANASQDIFYATTDRSGTAYFETLDWFGPFLKLIVALGDAKTGSTDLLDTYSWADIVGLLQRLSTAENSYYFDNPSGTVTYSTNYGIRPVYVDKLFQWRTFGDYFTGELNQPITLPSFDSETVGRDLVIAGVTAAVVAGLSVAVTVKAKKAINRRKSMNQAAVEKTYDDYWHDPTNPDKYNAYRKAVKKNNRFATIFGGTKYSKLNRWDDPASGDASADSGALSSVWNSIPETMSMDDGAVLDGPNSSTIVRLLTGA